jgi:hypothetical protein
MEKVEAVRGNMLFYKSQHIQVGSEGIIAESSTLNSWQPSLKKPHSSYQLTDLWGSQATVHPVG